MFLDEYHIERSQGLGLLTEIIAGMSTDKVVSAGVERQKHAAAGAARYRRMLPARVAGRVEVDRDAPVVLTTTAVDSVAATTTTLMYTESDTCAR